VFLLSNVTVGKQVELYHSGIKTLTDITDFEGLPANTQKQVKAVQSNTEIIDVEKISFLFKRS
jgi:hypothetical protein